MGKEWEEQRMQNKCGERRKRVGREWNKKGNVGRKRKVYNCVGGKEETWGRSGRNPLSAI